jgi:hypothetical protein
MMEQGTEVRDQGSVFRGELAALTSNITQPEAGSQETKAQITVP